MSATTQSEILEYPLKVYRKEVVSQVEQAHFTAVIADKQQILMFKVSCHRCKIHTQRKCC